MKTLRTIKGKQVVSWHFYRRRAEERLERLRFLQSQARLTEKISAPRQQLAQKALDAAGVNAHDELDIRKRGKFDARYDVVIDVPYGG